MVRFNASIKQDLKVPSDVALAASRSIVPGPVYSPNEVETVLRAFEPCVLLWTAKCSQDVYEELAWDLSEVKVLVQEAISNGRFIQSEWCDQKFGGPSAPCDAYEVTRTSRTGKSVKYYVKFAIARSGMVLLIASCHRSKPKKGVVK